MAGAREAREGLHEKRRLADPRVAADEGDRAEHGSPAEDAVELANAGWDAGSVVEVNVRDRAYFGRVEGRSAVRSLWSGLFDKRIPGAAPRAAP
jgi:hypothetical protein